MNTLTTPNITESVVIVAGKSNQATNIVHLLQLFLSLLVLNNVDDCWKEKLAIEISKNYLLRDVLL